MKASSHSRVSLLTLANTAGMVLLILCGIQARAQNNCAPLNSGLVGWWKGESDVLDSGGTNHGAFIGGATFAAGEAGQAFSFNGSGSHVEIPDSPALRFTNELTLELWYKDAGLPMGIYAGLVAKRNEPNGCNFGINMVAGSPGFFQVYLQDPTYGITPPTVDCPVPAPGIFHHLAATYRQASAEQVEVKVYIDGGLANTGLLSARLARTLNSTPVTIGSSTSGGGETFTGIIDEVSLYNRALSATEIAGIFAAGSAGKCFTGSPPQITQQPTNATVAERENAAFSVLVSGSGPLAFQWVHNGTNFIAGGTSSTLNLSSVQASNAGDYFVIVTNGFGSATSSVAVLTVLPPPPCIAPPSGLVAWWRGEFNTLDSAGANAGTLAGNVTFAAGEVGSGFTFDGSGDAVRLGRPASLQLQNLTIETWLKRAAAITGEGAVLCYGYGGYGLGMDGSGRPYLTRVGIDGVYCTTNIADTKWHHVALTKAGTNVAFFVDGVAYPSTTPYTSVFTFTTDIAIGARGDNLASSFSGQLDELSVYARALAPNELQAIYAAGKGGKCVVPIPAFTALQPTNQSVLRSNSATFTVGAGGTPPFTYQWTWNGTNIAGATTSTLTLTNVQFSQAGYYAVAVSNDVGGDVSASARLTVVFPPAAIAVAGTNCMSGSTVVVPINIVANGNENGLSFSLSYSPSLLTFLSAVPGPGAPDATMFVNSNQVGSGRVGITFALPTDATIAAGPQPIVLATFATPIRNTPTTAPISFGDTPTVRQLVDPMGTTLSATYSQGLVLLTASEFEGDISPRPSGDHAVTVADWVLLGRYVVRLDYPTNAIEFQRADSAPRATLGDGLIKVTDWVQAGRYASGLDPLTILGGPDTEGSMSPSQGHSRKDGPRRLSVVPNNLVQGTTGVVAVALESLGNENAVAASLSFDPSQLAFVSASKGSASSTATFNVNAVQATTGKLGFALALPTGRAFATGTCELVRVAFRAVGSTGSTNVSLTDSPVPREVSDAAADALTSEYAGGAVVIREAPVLGIQQSGNSVLLTWPGWATNFTLKAAGLPVSGSWTNMPTPPLLTNDINSVLLPIESTSMLYRLSQ
jgi:hypothetical protein